MSTGPSIVFPSRGLGDKGFKYQNRDNSDIRKTFARVKREQAAEAKRAAEGRQQGLDLGTVIPLPTRGVK